MDNDMKMYKYEKAIEHCKEELGKHAQSEHYTMHEVECEARGMFYAIRELATCDMDITHEQFEQLVERLRDEVWSYGKWCLTW